MSEAEEIKYEVYQDETPELIQDIDVKETATPLVSLGRVSVFGPTLEGRLDI